MAPGVGPKLVRVLNGVVVALVLCLVVTAALGFGDIHTVAMIALAGGLALSVQWYACV